MIGPGRTIDGTGDNGSLLVASTRDAFGGESVVYFTDRDGMARRDLYRPSADTVIDRALWRPDRQALAVVERPLVFQPGAELRILVLDEMGEAMAEAGHAFLIDIWWSGDGSRLFATLGGDDSTGRVTDLLSGEGVMNYCLRGGAPLRCL